MNEFFMQESDHILDVQTERQEEVYGFYSNHWSFKSSYCVSFRSLFWISICVCYFS